MHLRSSGGAVQRGPAARRHLLYFGRFNQEVTTQSPSIGSVSLMGARGPSLLYLLRQLVWRDIRSRYLGSLVGIFWSLLNPALQLIVYTLVFWMIVPDRLVSSDSTASFPELLFCGLLPFLALQESISRAARVLLEFSGLIKKAAIQLEVLPLSLVLSALLHQLLGTFVLAVVVAFTGSLSLATLPWLVPLLALQAALMIGPALLVAAVNVLFRDLAQMVSVGFMVLFWTTPIVYSRGGEIPSTVNWLLALNPLTHLVEGYRFAFFGTPEPSLVGLAYCAVWAGLLLGVGYRVLRRTRPLLLDLV